MVAWLICSRSGWISVGIGVHDTGISIGKHLLISLVSAAAADDDDADDDDQNYETITVYNTAIHLLNLLLQVLMLLHVYFTKSIKIEYF